MEEFGSMQPKLFSCMSKSCLCEHICSARDDKDRLQIHTTITMFCFIAARGCIAASQSGNVKCNKLSLNCSDKTTTLLLLRQLMQVSFEEGFYHNRQLLRNRSSTLRTQRKKTAAAVSKAIVCFLWADSVRFVGCSLLRGHAPKANTQFF